MNFLSKILPRSPFVFAIVVLVFSHMSCIHDDDTIITGPTGVKIQYNLVYNDGPFSIGEVYWDEFDHRIRIDNFMSYVSMMELENENGSEVLLKDFQLANFLNDNSYTVEVPAGKYDAMNFGLGVPVDFNKHVDPTTYPNDHPLSVPGSEGMFWAWNTGYIFVKFEGKADTLGVEGDPLLHPFAFHVGDDPFYRWHEADNLDIVVEAGKITPITITIHVDKILYGENDQIDLATDYLTHTSDNTVLATKVMDNFNAAITVD